MFGPFVLGSGRVRALFAWYDLWVGVFWDSKKRWLYVLPLPMVGLILDFSPRRRSGGRLLLPPG